MGVAAGSPNDTGDMAALATGPDGSTAGQLDAGHSPRIRSVRVDSRGSSVGRP